MEASDLVHEESSIIAKQLAHRAQLDGKNLIWDITMSSQESTQERIDDLRSAGYNRIDAVFVDIPIETSIRRTQARHREGQDKWRAGEGLGGRYVPPEVILRQADPDWGSKNRKHFEAAKATVNNWIVLDNSVDGHHAIVVESSKPKYANHDSPRGVGPMSEVSELLESLQNGTMSLDEVARRFRERSWPRRRKSPPETYLELAAAAQQDPEVYISESFDDVAEAHQDGRITDEQYTVLSEAVAESKRAEDLRNG